jgi:glycosyltransferase involved in cell wall biosynthesis
MKYYVESTYTRGTELNTGIQRVVRNVVNLSIGGDQRDIVPVVLEGGCFVPRVGEIPVPSTARRSREALGIAAKRRRLKVRRGIRNYLGHVYNAIRHLLVTLLPYPPFVDFVLAPSAKFGLTWLLKGGPLSRKRVPESSAGQKVEAQPGDVLVLVDSSWDYDIWPAALEFKRCGGIVVCVIYDLIPLSYPQYCDKALVREFLNWINQAMRHADAFLCISRTTAESVNATVPLIAPERRIPPRISYFWLGSELDGFRSGADSVRPDVQQITSGGRPFYLYVSTLEPRKNQAYALDAFELLWLRGIDATMVIVGRIGWQCDELVHRVRTHDEYGSRLLMFNDADDSELAWLYQHAQGLLFTSIVEGFGLPIVEALQQGLPVFASDIPVFREIAKDGVTFVNLGDPESLADALALHVASAAPRLPGGISWLSWQESVAQFWQRLDNCLSTEPDTRVLVPEVELTSLVDSGSAQSVVLPKDFWFAGNKVEIFRRGGEVVLKAASATPPCAP